MCPGGLDTIGACAVCFDPGNEPNVVPDAEVIENMNAGGKQYFPICGGYFGKVCWSRLAPTVH